MQLIRRILACAVIFGESCAEGTFPGALPPDTICGGSLRMIPKGPPWIHAMVQAPGESFLDVVALPSGETTRNQVKAIIFSSQPDCDAGLCEVTIFQFDACASTSGCELGSASEYTAIANCAPLVFRGATEQTLVLKIDSTRFAYRQLQRSGTKVEGVVEAPSEMRLRFRGTVDSRSRYSGPLDLEAAAKLQALDVQLAGRVVWTVSPP